jgi:hypothetical protein
MRKAIILSVVVSVPRDIHVPDEWQITYMVGRENGKTRHIRKDTGKDRYDSVRIGDDVPVEWL